MRISKLDILFFFITCFLSIGQGSELYALANTHAIPAEPSLRKFESAAAGSNRARRFETENNRCDPGMVTELFTIAGPRYQTPRGQDQQYEKGPKIDNTNPPVAVRSYSTRCAACLDLTEQSAMFPDHHFW